MNGKLESGKTAVSIVLVGILILMKREIILYNIDQDTFNHIIEL